MKHILLIFGAAYILFSALLAYPQAVDLVYLMQYKVSFQVAEALRTAGWEDVRLGLVSKHGIPTISTITIYASDAKGFKLAMLHFGEGAWEAAVYLKEVSDPDPTLKKIIFKGVFLYWGRTTFCLGGIVRCPVPDYIRPFTHRDISSCRTIVVGHF